MTEHCFVLPEGWLPTAVLQGKMWKAANMSSPTVEATLMESLGLLSQRNQACANILAPAAQRGVTAVPIDPVTKMMELSNRSRAWFDFSVCFNPEAKLV